MKDILNKHVLSRLGDGSVIDTPINVIRLDDGIAKEKKLVADLLSDAPDTLVKWLKERRAFIAGGSIMSVFSNNQIEYNDVDIYFRDMVSSAKFYAGTIFRSKPTCKTKNAESYLSNNTTYQIIKKTNMIGHPGEVVAKFDFTVCQAAFDFQEECFYVGERFFRDLSGRRLMYNDKSINPLSTLKRVPKYINKGFNIPSGELLKIAFAIRELKIENKQDLLEALEGISESFIPDKLSLNDMISKALSDPGLQSNPLDVIVDDGLPF